MARKNGISERVKRYLRIAASVVVVTILLALGMVTNRTITLSDEYIALKAKYIELERNLNHSKNHQNDSFDRGNGLKPKGFWEENSNSVLNCSDTSCEGGSH